MLKGTEAEENVVQFGKCLRLDSGIGASVGVVARGVGCARNAL